METRKPKYTYYHKMLMATFVMSAITGILGILNSLFIGLETTTKHYGDPTIFISVLAASLVAWIVLACITATKTENKLIKFTYYISPGIMLLFTILLILFAYLPNANDSSKTAISFMDLVIYLGGYLYICIISLLEIKKQNKINNIKK